MLALLALPSPQASSGDPVKVFDRAANLEQTQIISYRVDPTEKWCVLVGIAPGAPERPQLVKGFMQLYSVEQARSQALEAHAAAFTTLTLGGKQAPVISFAQKTLAAGAVVSKLHVIELGQPGQTSLKKSAELFFPPEFADDFPVSMQIRWGRGGEEGWRGCQFDVLTKQGFYSWASVQAVVSRMWGRGAWTRLHWCCVLPSTPCSVPVDSGNSADPSNAGIGRSFCFALAHSFTWHCNHFRCMCSHSVCRPHTHCPARSLPLPVLPFSDKYGLVYVITKLGLLFVYDLETATAVYRTRISADPIFLAAPAPSNGGFSAINRWAAGWVGCWWAGQVNVPESLSPGAACEGQGVQRLALACSGGTIWRAFAA